MISVVILILLTPSIEGVSSFRYSDGRQNPATHFPTCCPFTNPPSYSCSLEIVILEINKMMTYNKLLFFLILNCNHNQSLFYSIRESIYISSFMILLHDFASRYVMVIVHFGFIVFFNIWSVSDKSYLITCFGNNAISK